MAQMPGTEQVKQRKKVQCTVLPTVSATLAPALMSFVPDNIAMKQSPPLSQWGCNVDMMSVGFEHHCVGNIRYQYKGSREIVCAPYEFVYDCMGNLNGGDVEVSKTNTVSNIAEDFFEMELSGAEIVKVEAAMHDACLLYTSDAADDTPCVAL
eukprot:1047166-Pyramimonas_sp.AAC.1